MTAEPSDDDVQDRIDQKDATAFHIPKPGVSGLDWHPITYNEVHAVEIGAALGTVTGGLWASGATLEAMSLAAAVAGYAVAGEPFGASLDHDADEYTNKIGMATIKHEPWYFLVPMAAIVLGVMLLV